MWKARTHGHWRVRNGGAFFCLVLLIWVTFRISTLKSREQRPFSQMDIDSTKDSTFFQGCVDPYEYQSRKEYSKQNATFVMLTRNQELDGVLSSIHSIERHFNQWYQYPYVLLNDVPFTEEFVTQVRAATKADVQFGVLSELEWEFPPEVREQLLFKHSIEDQGDRGIMYGNMESYHKMCRFYSGAFYKHALVAQHEWYWRIEPDVEFFCDITYDPFVEMAKSGKKYGFTVLIKELYWTVPNLFRFTRSFIRQNNVKVGDLWNLFVRNYALISGDSLLDKLVNYDHDVETEFMNSVEIEHLLSTYQYTSEEDLDTGLIRTLIERATKKPPTVEDKFDNEEYNLCHFWSNFEIARVDLFSTGLYASYFEFLEQSGGFWSERWGDAPVHSLGLGMMLNAEDVHYFRDIGYQHSTLAHCPVNKAGAQLPYKPNAEYSDIFKRHGSVFKDMRQITRIKSSERSYGSGCRCVCPRSKDVEDTSANCFGEWFDLTRNDYKAPSSYDAKALMREFREDFFSSDDA